MSETGQNYLKQNRDISAKVDGLNRLLEQTLTDKELANAILNLDNSNIRKLDNATDDFSDLIDTIVHKNNKEEALKLLEEISLENDRNILDQKIQDLVNLAK